jgi:hypothetical protein
MSNRLYLINKIGRAHPIHCLLDRIDFLKVADNDFRAKIRQPFGSIIDGVNHHADVQSYF